MFAVLHLADFALHAVLRHEPVARGAPAALFSEAGKKSVVLAANSAARAAGVGPGLTAPQAVARCPRLLIRAPRAAAEAEARAALLAAGFLLSPVIEDTAPGTCTIDLRGATPGHGESAAARAVAQLAGLGLPATAGLARTPLLALLAAHAAQPARSLSPSEESPAAPRAGRTRTNEALEPSVLRIAPEAEKTFLAPLPLAAADPPPELAAVFAQWGLRTLGDLTALPRDEIVRRFGAAGLAVWRSAAGGDARPLRPVAPPREFRATLELEQAIETLEPLLFILRRFLDRLALELTAAQLVAAELDLTLRLEDGATHARRFHLPEPTADPEILFRALHTHLESLQTAAAITAADLRLAPARPLVRQQGLFDTGLRDPHGFAETLARLSALVGADRVGTPRPGDTHRPDVVTLAPPPAVIPPPAPAPPHPRLGPPLRRFRPPLPARLEFTAGRPSYLWTERFHGALASLHGPWLGSGDWWQADRVWRRAEWDVALADGGLYRLLRSGGAWFVEGEYD